MMRRYLFAMLLSALGILALAVVPAAAKMPAFSGNCPTNIKVRADGKGAVFINGRKASVKKSNENYYEARRGNITVSIAMDGSDLSVSYSRKGGGNGICSAQASAAAPGDNSRVVSKDEQACLLAVTRESNNGDVVTLSVETSEANNLVMVGVGAQRAPWKCLVKNGKVQEVTSQTDEGAL
jgi:hypothetical protein